MRAVPWHSPSRLLRVCMVGLVAAAPLWLLYAYLSPSTSLGAAGGSDAQFQTRLRSFVPAHTPDAKPVPWSAGVATAPSIVSAGGSDASAVPAATPPSASMPALTGGSDVSDVNDATLFPPQLPLSSEVVSPSRHTVGDESWAADQLEWLHDKYARIVAESPPHVQEVVKAMPKYRFQEIRHGPSRV